MNTSWALVCDFDGTATTDDIGQKVAIRFAGFDHWRKAEDMYRDGEYPFSGLLSRVFQPITAEPEEISAFARSIGVLRPGFDRLVAACRESSIPFILCSSGFDIYISPVLEQLAPELRSHIEIRSNWAVCSPTGLTVKFNGAGAGCGTCGFCKGPVVEELQASGLKVAYCGDGTSDRCAARVADRVFSCRSLTTFCKENGIPHHEFETFDEVLAQLPRA